MFEFILFLILIFIISFVICFIFFVLFIYFQYSISNYRLSGGCSFKKILFARIFGNDIGLLGEYYTYLKLLPFKRGVNY